MLNIVAGIILLAALTAVMGALMWAAWIVWNLD